MAYQMKHGAGKNSIDVEADAPQHTEKTRHAVRFQNSFLEFTQSLRRRVTGQHVLFPSPIVGIRDGM